MSKPRDAKVCVTYEEAHWLLSYSPSTGELRWKKPQSKRTQSGMLAGYRRKSGRKLYYRVVGINGTKYLAHRLAWLMFYGEWPPKTHDIDHANGDSEDNRIDNLRLATRSQNTFNTGRQINNISGFKGVSFVKSRRKFVAQTKINGKQTNLGRFDTAEEAFEAYKAATTKRFGEFARYE